MIFRGSNVVAFRSLLAVLILGAGFALAACGGDSGNDSADEATATAGSANPAGCGESFSSGISDTQLGIVKLSHAESGEIIVGTYTGEPFEAETYDEKVDGDGKVTSVAKGDCVATEVSADYGPLYLFVESEDGWHRLLESDPEVPLLPDPESQMEDIEPVQVESITG